ncbi:MAG: DUF4921 family protein [Patescibacteria group bacterium]|nr:DUF4921 family protein [Patescibacteria group bacterium]
MKKMKSQLRQDLVSGDWVVIAPGRAKRPHQLVQKNPKRKVSPIASCPFENPAKGGKPILSYGDGEWELQMIENKYPAFVHKKTCSTIVKDGPYSVTDTGGHHELLITRDHRKNFSELSKAQAQQVLEAFRDRYLMLENDACLHYVSLFQNWGVSAGASVYHPHYQFIAMPIVPPDVMHSLHGSLRYYRDHKTCVHCVMIEWERKYQKRIIYENDGAVVFAPFVSKAAFEMRVFPKTHLPYFENTLDAAMDFVADALQHALKKLKKNVSDPDYNFFIHTAPIKDKAQYHMYHWHIEIIPKISKTAGFELGTGIDIDSVDPDVAAKILRT